MLRKIVFLSQVWFISINAIATDMNSCIKEISEKIGSQSVNVDGFKVDNLQFDNDSGAFTSTVTKYDVSGETMKERSLLIAKSNGSVLVPLNGDLSCNTGSKFGNASEFLSSYLRSYLLTEIENRLEKRNFLENRQKNAAYKAIQNKIYDLTIACNGIDEKIDHALEASTSLYQDTARRSLNVIRTSN